MATLTVNLVMNDNDHIAPLACGDVVPEGIDLRLDRRSSFITARDNPAVDACEMSFSQYLIRHSLGERDWVGLPIFPMRAFRQRGFFVRRDSELQDLADLAGRRVGTNGWPDTGNTWARAALRERGVSLGEISWSVGPVDEPATGHHPAAALPPQVRAIAPDQTLRNLLIAGELDAIMCPWPPAGFTEPNSPIVRLVTDFRRAEQEYLRRVGFCPAHHLIVVRRTLFEKHPWVATSLFRAFGEAKRRWQESRRYHADTSPWLLADLEETATILEGRDWQAYGVAENRAMITALCAEEFEQGMVSAPINPNDVFTDFERTLA